MNFIGIRARRNIFLPYILSLIAGMLILCAGADVNTGVEAAPQPELQERQLMWGEQLRTYWVYEPLLDPGPDGRPLVIGLHATGATGPQFIGTARLIPKADSEGFILACPDALPFGNTIYFNAGGGYEDMTGGTDDIGFISAVIDEMMVNYDIDPTRVYAMGFSNGSMMAYRVAAELSHKISAIGAVSGQMVFQYPIPALRVPIIHFHGLSDPYVRYDGVEPKPYYPVRVLPVDVALELWREINICRANPRIIYSDGGVIGKRWASAERKGDIELYTIDEGVHQWPHVETLDISATDVIWDFFEKQSRTGEANEKAIGGEKRYLHLLRFLRLFYVQNYKKE